MCSNGTIAEYLNAGKHLTPLKGKKPTLNDWTSRKVSDEKVYSHNGNLGMVIGPGDLVLDIDPRNGGNEGFEKLTAELNGLVMIPTVVTPSGGRHYYMKMPEEYIGLTFKKKLRRFPGVDFLTQGAQCVIVSSTIKGAGSYDWFDPDFGGFEQEDAPAELLDLFSRGQLDNSDPSDLGDFDGLVGSGGWSKEKVLEMLSKLDPSMPNDEWVKVGMALHDWDPVGGQAIWEYWSTDGDNYIEGETEKRWRSFHSTGEVTLGSIAFMAKSADFDKAQDRLADYLKRISSAPDNKTIETELAPDIRKDKVLSSVDRERVASVIQSRFKELTGSKLPISECRDMIRRDAGLEVARPKTPEWCNNWVYINSHRGFVDYQRLQIHKAEAFNLINSKHTPLTLAGNEQSASTFVAAYGLVQVVHAMAYLPMYEERICTMDGEKVLNTFNTRTLPETAEEFSKAGKQAIGMVKKHIKFICSTDENADILTQWLASQVQNPGKQILWSPLIQSIPGTGKSFFSDLLGAVLGDKNVGTVAPGQVTSDFNGWAANVAVNVLEELQIRGHNRYEVINALKPLLTDRMIQINEKGVKPYRTLNTANYICFTNSKDALPLEESDRRWWVIFVPISKLDQLEEYVGDTADDYFPKLFGAVKSYGDELRKWLMEYEITDEFMTMKRAPMTEYKQMMVATEEAAIEGLAEVREMLENGGEWYNSDVLSTSHLFSALIFEHPELEIRTSSQTKLLKRLGYQKVPSKVKVKGESLRLWTSRSMTNEEIRTSLS